MDELDCIVFGWIFLAARMSANNSSCCGVCMCVCVWLRRLELSEVSSFLVLFRLSKMKKKKAQGMAEDKSIHHF